MKDNFGQFLAYLIMTALVGLVVSGAIALGVLLWRFILGG